MLVFVFSTFMNFYTLDFLHRLLTNFSKTFFLSFGYRKALKLLMLSWRGIQSSFFPFSLLEIFILFGNHAKR